MTKKEGRGIGSEKRAGERGVSITNAVIAATIAAAMPATRAIISI